MASRSKSLSSNIANSAIASGFVIVVTFVNGLVIAWLLEPQDRGIYGALQFVGFFIAGFWISFFDASVIRLRRDVTDQLSALCSTICFLSLVLVLASWGLFLFLLVSEMLSFEPFDFVVVVVFFCSITLLELLNKSFASLEAAKLNFSRLNLERVTPPLIFCCIILGLWLVGAADLMMILIALVVSRVPILLWRMWRFRDVLAKPVDLGFLSGVLKLGAKLQLATGAFLVASQIDRMLVITLWPAEWLGYYFVAFSACGAGVSLASQALQMTLLPTLAGLLLVERRDKTERLLRLSLLLAIGLIAAVWVLAPWLVPLAYGAAYLPAVDYVRGLIFAIALTPMLAIVNSANRSQERSQPGVETALAIIACLGIGWLLTGFQKPQHLFVSMAFGNAVGILVGLRHLVRDGSLRFGMALIPTASDVAFVLRVSTAHARALMAGRR